MRYLPDGRYNASIRIARPAAIGCAPITLRRSIAATAASLRKLYPRHRLPRLRLAASPDGVPAWTRALASSFVSAAAAVASTVRFSVL